MGASGSSCGTHGTTTAAAPTAATTFHESSCFTETRVEESDDREQDCDAQLVLFAGRGGGAAPLEAVAAEFAARNSTTTRVLRTQTLTADQDAAAFRAARVSSSGGGYELRVNGEVRAHASKGSPASLRHVLAAAGFGAALRGGR